MNKFRFNILKENMIFIKHSAIVTPCYFSIYTCDLIKLLLSKHISYWFWFQFPGFFNRDFSIHFQKVVPSLQKDRITIGCIHNECQERWQMSLLGNSHLSSKVHGSERRFLRTQRLLPSRRPERGSRELRLVSRTWIPWKVTGQIILEAISKPIEVLITKSSRRWLWVVSMDWLGGQAWPVW